MRRREFITLVGGAAAWPLAAHAQQAGMRRVGLLIASRPSDGEMQARIRTLHQELQRLGWIKGVNIQFDERWTTDDMELIRAHAINLVELNPDVIVASGGRVIPIFLQLTRSIPIIVPGVGDPVQEGLAQSLAHPGGNVSGFTFFEPSVLGKILEVLKQIAPDTSRVAVIYNPNNAINAYALRLTENFAGPLGIDPVRTPFQTIAELEHALEPMANRGNGAIFSIPDLTVVQMRSQITELAIRLRLPAIYSDRIMTTSGGLASYDADRIGIYRGSASYVDRVLRGEKVGDLPFQQPSKYNLFINLKTAKVLGLIVPNNLLSTADEVIE
jgi:putative tryptophan/tyrosine transport system substrate-binding protein